MENMMAMMMMRVPSPIPSTFEEDWQRTGDSKKRRRPSDEGIISI